MDRTWSRRGALKAGGFLTGGLLAGGIPSSPASAAVAVSPSAARRRVLRVAHLTDAHVQPEKRGREGLIACLEHVHGLNAGEGGRPDLILAGGDNIMDAFGQTFERSRMLFDLWAGVLKDHCTIPVEHCVGNHDVWGWRKDKSQTTGLEKGWGKAWACEVFGLERPYRVFERAGWRFVVLDSTHTRGPDDHGYIARLDDAQFEWLSGELAAKPTTPTLVLSHIPILSASAYFDGDNEKDGDWKVPGAWMHIDARRIKGLFHAHPQVKVCLSGHIHLVDRVDYLGVTYLCNGAVSGAWWDGPCQEFRGGYALVDLFDDGTFEHRYVVFPWTGAKE
ncbi:MAG: metallophosphoesterase [Phycisphaeraceae bacterium]|nr:MAG: metallophosphoesterase [Phycisphaeraceae bacterium]